MKKLTKEAALDAARRRQLRLNTEEARATASASARDRALLDAQRAGASYAEMQEATGLSTARVTQILRRAKRQLTLD